MSNQIETISLAAHESHCERLARIIRWVVVGWAASVIMLGLVIMTMASYEEEIVTTEVTQESEDNGNNLYAGGDMTYGNANGQDDASNPQEGNSGE